MIVDVRTYTAQPGLVPKYFADYAAQAFATQTKNLGQPLGYYMVETGVVNTVVHLWGYKDIAERQAKRDALYADPVWQTWMKENAGTFVAQNNTIMKNVPFWPAEGHSQGGYGLVDFRLYTFKHGKLAEFFKLYKEEGWPVQSKTLGNCVGYYQSDIGGLNQILHLWAYKDAADRAARRATLGADPAWKAYLTKASPLLQRMENTLLVNAPFFKP